MKKGDAPGAHRRGSLRSSESVLVHDHFCNREARKTGKVRGAGSHKKAMRRCHIAEGRCAPR